MLDARRTGRCASLRRALSRLSVDSGATAIEYAIMISLIAAVIFSVIVTLGQDVRSLFQSVLDALSG